MTVLYRKQFAEIGFIGSKTTILTWATRSVKIDPGTLGTFNCSPFWAQSQKMFVEQLDVTTSHFHAPECHGKVQKIGKCVPHELNDRQMERRQTTCEILLARQKKGRSHSRWSPADATKRTALSSVRGDLVSGKMLLKPGKRVNAARYHQQLIKLHRALCEKRPDYQQRHDKLIFLHDNAPSHTSTIVQNYLERLNWEVLPHAAYLPWPLPTTTCFVDRPRARWAALWFWRRRPKMSWWVICLEREEIFLVCYPQISKRWQKCVASEGQYFE